MLDFTCVFELSLSDGGGDYLLMLLMVQFTMCAWLAVLTFKLR
jgi:hypothetical protein